MATIEDFQKLDIRVGKIVEVQDFPEAKKPSYKLKIDFGEGIAAHPKDGRASPNFIGRGIILGVVNFPPKNIGPFVSEVLTLGVPDQEGRCVLVVPDKEIAKIGGKLY